MRRTGWISTSPAASNTYDGWSSVNEMSNSSSATSMTKFQLGLPSGSNSVAISELKNSSTSPLVGPAP